MVTKGLMIRATLFGVTPSSFVMTSVVTTCWRMSRSASRSASEPLRTFRRSAHSLRMERRSAVSYTHLDVYKRQLERHAPGAITAHHHEFPPTRRVTG